MPLDFTLAKYAELCRAIQGTYEPKTVLSYLTEPHSARMVILRHDVDRKPQHALKMAQLESAHGIKSTYYFRMKPGVFLPDLIRTIADLGHEIGYHYEVLDKANGDPVRSLQIFSDELSTFREIYDVKTICMHGNPLSPWLNRDLWKTYDFRDFGILGEPYLSLDYTKVVYFTDTGRKWNSAFSVKDTVSMPRDIKVKTTDDLIDIIQRGEKGHMCILTHPNRWSNNMIQWSSELIWQNIKNIGKIALKKGRYIQNDRNN